jgi:dipeptidyl-peptidase 4
VNFTHALIGIAALSNAAVLGAQQAPATQLTLEQVASSGAITGSVPASLAWSPDSKTLAFAWDSAGSTTREVWLVSRDGKNRRAVTPFRSMAREGGAREIQWSRDGRSLLVLRGNALMRVNPNATGAARIASIATVGRDAHELTISPSGAHAAYVREGDVWLVAIDPAANTSTPRRLTSVSVPSISSVASGTYARLDREIGPATWGSAAPSYAWSPDGRTLAVHLVDRRAVRRVLFPYYLGDSTLANPVRRSYPGDANETRQVALVEIANGTLTPLPFAAPTGIQIANFAWSSQGVLMVDRESDDATERWVHVLRPGEVPRLVYHDQRASRIYTEVGSTWSSDGQTILLTADRDDRYRVYAVSLDDTTPRPLTPAQSDVQGSAFALAYDSMAWVSNAHNRAERHLWRAVRGGEPVRVTQRAGTHRVIISPDGATVASIVSDDVTPPSLLLVPMIAGAEVTVTQGGGALLTSVGIIAPHYVQFVGADSGEILFAKVWIPPRAFTGGAVPVVFGPIYSNTVRNRWGGTYGLLQQLLVQRGYAVIQVDVRGSTGYGRAFREAFLFEWGGKDLDDLAAAKRWLGTQSWADTTRTGVFGSSYGGLISVYALFKRPGLFQAGVAGAAATDPRFYGSDDVAIARTPASHPEVFQRGALQYAGGLQDHLMLVHGLMDDVVPFKTTADLAEELMRLGKDFDLVIAPSATHAWTSRPDHALYLLRKLVAHFDRYLAPG